MSLRNKFFLLFLVITFIFIGLIVASNRLISRVKIGGKSYNGIELKYEMIDMVARARVNLNMLDSDLKSQIYDEYDDENVLSSEVERISEIFNYIGSELVSAGDGKILGCVSCHSSEVSGEVEEPFLEVTTIWQNISTTSIAEILMHLADDDQDAAVDSYDNFIDNYQSVMAQSKEVIVALREAVDLIKEQKKQEATIFTYYFTGIGLLVVLLILGVTLFIVENIVRHIRKTVEAIHNSAASIIAETDVTTKSADANAHIATNIAASLEETSSSLEEITAMVQQNNSNATDTDSAMHGVLEIINIANADVDGMRDSMNTIKSDSDKIGKIITEIDGISFQTNLLALNAAVEAARAGEAGAGFAVVADEVRNLALRTADSATNTQDLIEIAVQNINSGLEIVSKVDKAMAEISASTKKTSVLVEEISQASEQQSIGISQINNSTTDMEAKTQDLAAGSESLSAASTSVLAQIKLMFGIIDTLSTFVDGGTKPKKRSEAPSEDNIMLPRQ